eukprot:3754833-Pleurochrysis_carterae.AAC.2
MPLHLVPSNAQVAKSSRVGFEVPVRTKTRLLHVSFVVSSEHRKSKLWVMESETMSGPPASLAARRVLHTSGDARQARCEVWLSRQSPVLVLYSQRVNCRPTRA